MFSDQTAFPLPFLAACSILLPHTRTAFWRHGQEDRFSRDNDFFLALAHAKVAITQLMTPLGQAINVHSSPYILTGCPTSQAFSSN